MSKSYVGIIGSVLLLMFTVSLVADPPGPEVELILDKFELIRPQDRDLSLFKLDWEKTLKSALVRAAREDRPVLLILVRNSNGDIFQGHC
jgi:flagellin-like protein